MLLSAHIEIFSASRMGDLKTKCIFEIGGFSPCHTHFGTSHNIYFRYAATETETKVDNFYENINVLIYLIYGVSLDNL